MEKKNKTIFIRRHELIENPKKSIKKLLELTKRFSKAKGFKIGMQKWIIFLYIYNEQSKNEIKKVILFMSISRIIKYLKTNLTEEL